MQCKTRETEVAQGVAIVWMKQVGLASARDIRAASGQPDCRVVDIVSQLRRGGLHSKAAAKSLSRAFADQAVMDSRLDETARRIASVCATHEAHEGLDAYLVKRIGLSTSGLRNQHV